MNSTVVIIILIAIGILMALPIKTAKKEEPKEEPKKEVKPEPPTVFLMLDDVQYGAPKNMKRTYKNGESLTDNECDFIYGRLRLKLPCCPDCESGDFLEGPSGGGSTNVKCSNKQCGSLFNLMPPFGIDRISDASPDKPLEMVSFGPNR